MKKVLSVILSVVLMITLMPMNGICEYLQNFTLNFLSVKANAADESVFTFELSGDGDSYIITKCNESAEGNLTIPSEYNGKPVTSIADEAFAYCFNLTSVEIPESITNIGNYAFFGCSNIYIAIENETELPETPKGLKSVIINGNGTVIGEEAFEYCSELETVELYNVAEIGDYAFFCCSSLYMSVFSELKTDENSGGLKSVIIDGNNTVIGSNAFSICFELESVTLNGVSEIGEGAFTYCIKLSSVTIPESVKYIDKDAFSYCSDSVLETEMGMEPSENPSGLETVIINGSDTSVNRKAFAYCDKLNSIQLSGITSIYADAFNDTAYYNDKTNLENGVLYIDDCLIYADGEVLSGDYTIKDGTSTVAINAFSDCDNLKSLTVPDCVENFGLSAYYSQIICNCSSPVAETLGEYFSQKLTVNHNNQFLSETPATCTQHGYKTYICDVCKTQTDVETPLLSHDFSEEWTIDENPTCIKEGVKSHHCKNCSAITDVTSVPVISHTYGEWITDTEPTLTEEGLRHHICTVCKDTVYENIPMYLTFKLNSDKNTYTVVSCDNSFSGDLVIPEKYNGKPVTNIGSGAFAGCTKITTATIPKDITVGEEAFSNCSPDLVIKCRKNSSAYQYATSENIKYELILLNIDCTENSFIDKEKKVIVTDNQEIFFIQEIVSAPSDVEAVCENHDKTAKRYYGTGDIISVYSDGVFVCNYTIIVNNDLDGDGICDVIDIELAEKFTAGVYEPTDAQVYALTNSLDEEITASDYQNIVNTALSR